VTVVDSCVVIKWILPEPGRTDAVRLLDAFEAGAEDLIAPQLLMDEIASALSKRCRRRQLTARQAAGAFRMLELRHPLLVAGPALITSAFALSIRHQLSYWDSVYLALAIERRCDLVTADRRFYSRVQRHYPFVSLLASGSDTA
jgi:predicted nucleic acid-binding protein